MESDVTAAFIHGAKSHRVGKTRFRAVKYYVVRDRTEKSTYSLYRTGR